MIRPKYKKYTFVKTISGVVGIVNSTYGELCGGSDLINYSLYIVKNDKVVNRCSWYWVESLTPLEEQNYEKALSMIEDYHYKKN